MLEIDGRPRRLCLTLGALARIEALLDPDSAGLLEERLRRGRPGDLIGVVAALCEGAGDPLSPDELAAARIAPAAAAAAVAEAFRQALG